MKLLKWTDASGLMRQSWVKDDVDIPDYGIPNDPPDLSSLGLPPAVCKTLHNHLVENGLITYLDVLKSGNGVTSILRQMGLKQYRQQLLTLYKLDNRR